MGVLIQAMVWMGLPQPPAWQMVLYLACIGMFGVGVGMLYTPILVDRMRLAFPSGPGGRQHPARADRPALLRRSVQQLGGGMTVGLRDGDWLRPDCDCWARSGCPPPPSARAWSSARASASRP